MDKRFLQFMMASLLVVMAYSLVMTWLFPAPEKPVLPKRPDAVAEAPQGAAGAAPQAGTVPAAAAPTGTAPTGAPAAPAAAEEPAQPETRLTLGSLDPASPYRMLVTLTSVGAAIERIELNHPRFLDGETLHPRGGYLGHLVPQTSDKPAGCLVRVVGPGTPADRAGLRVGDVIEAIGKTATPTVEAFDKALNRTRPRERVTLSVVREGKQVAIEVPLARYPLEVVRPEREDPLSCLVTLDEWQGQRLLPEQVELPGVALRTAAWKPRRLGPDEIEFTQAVGPLEVVKRFRLATLPAAPAERSEDYPAYHVELTLEFRLAAGAEATQVAYRLDGPTGLPLEGRWYAMHSKISPYWRGGAGMRDVVVGFLGEGNHFHHGFRSCETIQRDDQPTTITENQPVVYLGVDAQYFASVLIPLASAQGTSAEGPPPPKFRESHALQVGPDLPKNEVKLVNVGVRLVSEPLPLAPGQSVVQKFQLFAGPKRNELLNAYALPHGLERLVEYGWVGWVARPLQVVLHAFYWLTGNYGLAIILLTVVVRSAMFPISRKQALNAAKMQELQPEIKRLQEKYKNLEQRQKAQAELFKKHNYNPFSGCLPVFIQLPIFMGLYRSLAVDVELRQAPLITESFGWATNLAAPDMLFRWDHILPEFLAGPDGYLGPFFNLLPCLTIGLFLWQQKMFMPPPMDEQQALQQKMMTYMMIFFAVMFFKVPSGLCVYFIASSIWGLAERKFLPKAAVPQPATASGARTAAAAANGSDGAATEAPARKPQGGKR